MSDSTRINKFLAHHLGLSRREADNAVSAGRVTINGTRAAMGAQVPVGATVKYDGKAITEAHSYTYLLLNKPAGYVCSRKRQGDSPTIYELLEQKYRPLKPVGRLDRDSSGILVLTDDGDFAHQMTHPKFQKRKVYEVEIDSDLAPLHQQMINDYGVQLDDGASKLTLERMDDKNRTAWRVIMSEGRNRQIRRTFAALGYTVIKLHRTDFGPFAVGNLKSGHVKATEVN